MTKTLLGYSDRFSVRPGERIGFKVSSETGAPFNLQIVRILHGDTNPAGPGYQEEPVPASVEGRYPGRRQSVQSGSYGVVPAHPALSALTSFTAAIGVQPMPLERPRQAIMTLWDAEWGTGFALMIDHALRPVLWLSDGDAVVEAMLDFPLEPRHWHRLTGAFDATTATATLQAHGAYGVRTVEAAAPLQGLGAPAAPLWFAALPAKGGGRSAHFNGRLEAPMLSGPRGVVAAWDFSRDISSETLSDVSGAGLHGFTRQLPDRAVRGSAWMPETRDWRQAPDQYGAIHFHEDDLVDAGWDETAAWAVPEGQKSGLYAAKLVSAEDEDYLPFIVAPPLRATPAPGRLLLILPSASYLAYANEHIAIDAPLAERVHDHAPAFTANDLYTAEHRELGPSLYDRHPDGSGAMISSLHRPILNMRPKIQSWLGGGGHSSLWQMNADTHIIGWLERQGVAYDIIGDEDLHAHGREILPNYRCVMSGTHPEYTSTAMFDALEAYQAQGGRMIYMGGNGFYWRVAYHPTRPGVIELRRTEVGSGWLTPPGEAHHAFNGEYGGLWRRIGRSAHAMFGVGFISQGFDACSYYRRTPQSRDPRAAFIFEGVEEEIIGDFGLIGGGAAGIEIDSVDPLHGTPANTLVLARSEGHSDNYLPTIENLFINYLGQGGSQNAAVHADMVFFETPSGGAVFSTGSIAWAGSLSHNGDDNAVSRITMNIVQRFLHEEPFGGDAP